MYDEKYELELVKRTLDVTKRELAVLDAELEAKKPELDLVIRELSVFTRALGDIASKVEEAKYKDFGEGHITYSKENVDDVTRLVVNLAEAVDSNRIIKRAIKCDCVCVSRDVDLNVQNVLDSVLNFLNSYVYV